MGNDYILPVELGKTSDGQTFAFDLAKAGNVLVTGASGYGKSNVLQCFMTSLLKDKSPEDLRLVPVDCLGVEFGLYERLWDNFVAQCGEADSKYLYDTDDDVRAVLVNLVDELQKREFLFEEHKVTSINEYNKHAGDAKLPYIVSLFDSLENYSIDKKDMTFLRMLLENGTRFGMFSILSYYSPKSIPLKADYITSLFSSFITLHLADSSDFKRIPRGEDFENPNCEGEACCCIAGKDAVRVLCNYIATESIEEVVNIAAKKTASSYILG